MQDRKMAEVEKTPLGPRGKKIRRLPIFFVVGWGKKHRLEEKKFVGWKIPPPIPGNARTFPRMQDRKTAQAEKNPLGPKGKKKCLLG